VYLIIYLRGNLSDSALVSLPSHVNSLNKTRFNL